MYFYGNGYYPVPTQFNNMFGIESTSKTNVTSFIYLAYLIEGSTQLVVRFTRLLFCTSRLCLTLLVSSSHGAWLKAGWYPPPSVPSPHPAFLTPGDCKEKGWFLITLDKREHKWFCIMNFQHVDHRNRRFYSWTYSS